jgi:polyhydroxyalkanoate synthesis repressor PhaR
MTHERTEPRLIKKYPNRRLYDTRSSAYITLQDVKHLVQRREAFSVVDARTAEDLTRSILLQIILDEESGDSPMFSSAMLSEIIRFHGRDMQTVIGNYLEKNMQGFLERRASYPDAVNAPATPPGERLNM